MKTNFGLLGATGLCMIFLVSCTKKDEQPEFVRKQGIKDFICTTDFHVSNKSRPSTSAIGTEKYFWFNNPQGPIVIHVKFLQGGSDCIREKVEQYAKEWEKYANVRFDFVDRDEPAEIRISFDIEAYSYVWAIGTYLLDLSEDDQYNMHYADLNDDSPESDISGSVLHEFGHVLGLMHEQYHPRARWNKPYIYAYYKREKGWSKKVVNEFFFEFRVSNPTHSKYDPKSIMHYWYPKEFALDHAAKFGANELSDGDKDFIQKIYPFPAKN